MLNVRRSDRSTAPLVNRSAPERVRYTHFGRVTDGEQSGYRSATVASRDGPTIAGLSGSRAHEIPHREALQRQSRQFKRDNGLYSGMLRRARSFIVGNGFKLQCQTRSRKWNETTEQAFAEWWRRPEVTGQFSGSQVEDLVCDELLTCGELGVSLTSLGLIQIFEAEQIRAKGRATGANDDGIERDQYGRPTRFSVTPYGANGQPDSAKAVSYGPGEFLYVAALERPSSSRAVPPCQASFPMLHRIDDIANSEAAGWQVRAKFAAAINRAAGAPAISTVAHDEDGEDDTSTEGSPTGANVAELEEAILVFGEPGDTITALNQAAPASTFEASLVMCIRLLGVPLGLPIEMTLLDWTKSNYSQSRAVLEQARVSFLSWQDLLETHFYRPIYLWWLQREVEAGRIAARSDMFEHDWNQPQPPWIDQLAETQAQGEKVDRGLGTRSDALKAQNLVPEKVNAQLVAEEVAAWEACNEVEKQTGGAYRPSMERFLGLKIAKPEAKPAAAPAASTPPAQNPPAPPPPPAPPSRAESHDDMRASGLAETEARVPFVIHNHIAPAAVSVEAAAPVVVPAPVVNVAPAAVNVDVAAPVVNVDLPEASTPKGLRVRRGEDGKLLGADFT